MNERGSHVKAKRKWKAVPAPLKLDLNASVSADPYLVWAALIGFEGYGGGTADDVLPVLIEFPVDIDVRKKEKALPASVDRLQLLADFPAYATRYVTAMLPMWLLPVLVQLLQAGEVQRFQLGAARGTPVRREATLLATIDSMAPLKTMGVIDDGCCLAHESFRTATPSSRFLCVWDQSPSATFPEATPWGRFFKDAGTEPRYGAELSFTKIGNLLNRHPHLGEAKERALYRAIDRPHWGDSGRIHGACVLHALAGPRAEPLPAAKAGQLDADGLPIIFVQLPDETVKDTSGGSVGFYVLDGARYIARRTQEFNRGGDDKWSTTINVSLGSIGGPHDGSTIVERALDELIATYKKDQVRIVIAAGNTAGRKLHAVREVSRSAPGRFYVMAQPGNLCESFVELWPRSATGAQAEDGAQLLVSVKAPDGSVLEHAKLGEVHTLRHHGVVVASLVRPRAVAQGEHGTMILLAMRPTASQDIHATHLAPFGIWEILVESTARKTTQVHAWVERNDTTVGLRGPQRTTFVSDVAPDSPGYVRDDSTLSSMANGRLTDCAGAYEVNRMEVADYSANGPVLGAASSERPGLYGVAEASRSLPGINGPGFFSGSHARLSGTSSGAPRVARWHAEGDPTAEIVSIAPTSAANTLASEIQPVGVKPPPELRRK